MDSLLQLFVYKNLGGVYSGNACRCKVTNGATLCRKRNERATRRLDSIDSACLPELNGGGQRRDGYCAIEKPIGETYGTTNGTKMAGAPTVNAWSTKSTMPFFPTGDYAPVFDELITFDLPVEGAIPPQLNGWHLPPFLVWHTSNSSV